MILESHDTDPVVTNPGLYRTVFENERVRVLEYRDVPGDRTEPHSHPDSVMITLSAFRRRVSSGDREVEVDLPAGQARWVGAQSHVGENIGGTPTHSFFVELKEPRPDGAGDVGAEGTTTLGPST
jgi:beta-alanine degradation protein BauB